MRSVAQELAGERANGDPALGADDQIEGETEKIGLLREDAVALVRGHRGPAGQERRIVTGRERLGLAQHLIERGPGGERA